MARCPHCRRGFRVMEDEDDGQHDCPHCGYSAHDRTLDDDDLAAEEDHIRDRDSNIDEDDQ